MISVSMIPWYFVPGGLLLMGGIYPALLILVWVLSETIDEIQRSPDHHFLLFFSCLSLIGQIVVYGLSGFNLSEQDSKLLPLIMAFGFTFPVQFFCMIYTLWSDPQEKHKRHILCALINTIYPIISLTLISLEPGTSLI